MVGLGRLHDRYFIRGLVPLVASAFAAIALLYVVFEVMLNMDEIAGRLSSFGLFGTAWLVFAVYSVRVLAYACEFVGPGIFLVGGALHAVSLARENEFVGLLASGVSMKRSLAPSLAVAGCLAILAAGLRETPLPQLRRLEEKCANALFGWRDGVVREMLVKASGGAVLVVEEYDPEAGVARGFVWTERGGGWRVVSEEARWEEESSSWVFPDGGEKFDYRREKTRDRVDELRTSTGPEALEFETLGPRALTLGQLSRVGGRKARVSLHARLSGILSWIILAALGLPVVVRYAGRSALTGAGLCLLLAAGYELASWTGLALASGGALPVWVGAWCPKLAFGCLAGAVYSMSDRG